jgi:hypothetical protein
MSGIRLDATGIVAGLIFIAIGGAFVLDRLDLWTVDLRYLWPAVLIALGAIVMLRATLARRG